MEVRELLSSYQYPAMTSHHPWLRPVRLEASSRNLAMTHPEADGRGRCLHPQPVRALDRPFLMPIEDVSRSPPWHRGDRPCRAWHRPVGEEVEIVGIKAT